MVPFDFELRTRVVFGHRCFTRLGTLAREVGFRRTLVVADGGLVAAGHAGEALPVLHPADAEARAALATRLEDLAGAGGLTTTLSDSGVGEAALPQLAEEAAQQWTAAFNPRPLDAAGALEIYRASL